MRLHLAIVTDFSKLRHFSIAIFSETKSMTPIFFSFLEEVPYDLTLGEK